MTTPDALAVAVEALKTCVASLDESGAFIGYQAHVPDKVERALAATKAGERALSRIEAMDPQTDWPLTDDPDERPYEFPADPVDENAELLWMDDLRVLRYGCGIDREEYSLHGFPEHIINALAARLRTSAEPRTPQGETEGAPDALGEVGRG